MKKIPKIAIVQLVLVAIAAALVGYEITSTWGRDTDATPVAVLVTFICLAAVLLPLFGKKPEAAKDAEKSTKDDQAPTA